MSLTACWQLVQIFGPLLVVMWLATTRPVNNLYARYLQWVDSKFKPSRDKWEAEQAKRQLEHRKVIADIKFRHLDIWYDSWFESFAPEPCPLRHLRKCEHYREFTYHVEPDTGYVEFRHPDTAVTRRWHLSTLDMDK